MDNVGESRPNSSTDVFRVVKEIRIQAPPELVFSALTDPAEVKAWWVIPGQYETRDAQLDVRVGGRYRVSGTSVRLKEFAVTGVYRIVEPPHRLSYTWTPDWDAGARDSIVDIRLEPEGEETRVIVTHTMFSTQSARDSHAEGWPAVLDALRTHAEARVAPD
jgi:uncharacterized protein YndB with AHSA1/START domain